MAQFAGQLQIIASSYIRHPVVDATGLEGAWDFSFNFSAINPSQLATMRAGLPAGLPADAPGASDPLGGTSLFDAILDASTYLRPYVGRRVLVIVSDGIETTSRHSDFDFVVQHVLADDCQVYVVQTGLYEGANLRALAAERRMEQLTGQTGGAVYLPKSTDQLDVAFDQIAADLSQQYILSYYPSAEHRDGRVHNLELRVKSRNDVRVRSRKGYYAPKPATAAGW